MFRTRRSRLLILAALFYLTFCLISGIFLADATLRPQRRPLTVDETAAARTLFQQQNATLTDVSITTPDAVTLSAWLIRPPQPNGNSVLLLHGLGDNRLGMTGYAQLLLAHSYTVLLPDARAHGQSGGPLATYGLLERNDIHQWADFLATQIAPPLNPAPRAPKRGVIPSGAVLQAERGISHPSTLSDEPNRSIPGTTMTSFTPHDSSCVFGFAESMGAAQLLQSLDTHPNFCAVAVESPFSTFREIAYDRMGQPFHLGSWVGRLLLRPLVEVAFLHARFKYHLDMSLISPEDSVTRTNIPVLLMHGQDDSNIPIRHSRAIHARAPQTQLWEVPNAEHCGAISTAPEEFQRRLLAWFSDRKPVAISELSPSRSSVSPCALCGE